MTEPLANTGLRLDDRLGLDLARKVFGSSIALLVATFINLGVEFKSSGFSWTLRTLSILALFGVMGRIVTLRGALSKQTYPENEIRFVRRTILPLMALIVLSIGRLLFETGFSGITSLIPIIEICAISITSLFTVATHLKTTRGVQGLAAAAVLIPLAVAWSGNHSPDLLNLMLVFVGMSSYLIGQAGVANKQLIEKFKYEISLEETNVKLVASRAKVIEETAKAENASRLATLGEMAGGIAHEINNPITIISLLANKLERAALKGEVEPDLVIAATHKMEETCVRVSKIIKGLRSFSRNGDQDAFELITIEGLWSQVLDFASGRLYNSEINVVVEHEMPSDTLECRSVQISQVLVNLLNNAADSVQGTKDAWIRIQTRATQDAVDFRITDSGGGIPVEVAAKIFNPFFTTKEIGKGTGLGLSISLGLIRQHYGRISLDQACKNTSFIIELPKRQPLQEPIEQKPLLQSEKEAA